MLIKRAPQTAIGPTGSNTSSRALHLADATTLLRAVVYIIALNRVLTMPTPERPPLLPTNIPESRDAPYGSHRRCSVRGAGREDCF